MKLFFSAWILAKAALGSCVTECLPVIEEPPVYAVCIAACELSNFNADVSIGT